jgi:CspA family cold shock protein
VVQSYEGLWLHRPPQRRQNVFFHIPAVQRAGLSSLVEGQSVTFDIVMNRGKEAADNLKLAR